MTTPDFDNDGLRPAVAVEVAVGAVVVVRQGGLVKTRRHSDFESRIWSEGALG